VPRTCTIRHRERCHDMEVLPPPYDLPKARINDAGSQKTAAISNQQVVNPGGGDDAV
jgi:hypothetical protein